jgi:hypothetical protein
MPDMWRTRYDRHKKAAGTGEGMSNLDELRERHRRIKRLKFLFWRGFWEGFGNSLGWAVLISILLIVFV